MELPDWERIASHELARLRYVHVHRQRRIVRPLDATHVEIGQAEKGTAVATVSRLVNFASNNYLGLTHHPRIIAEIRNTAERNGAGSGAAPLITGYSPVHATAEQAIARWKHTQAAVLLPSGYQANTAAIQTLATLGTLAGGKSGVGTRFLLDKLCHASLIDAVRAAAVQRRQSHGHSFRMFPHNDMEKLSGLLQGAEPGQMQVVITESIFSMDGDAAMLTELAQLKREHPFLLLLDEAHGSGVYGPEGSGLAAELGLTGLPDIIIVTLSKALGCVGAAICANETFCDLMVNVARPFIYSTALPPTVAAAAEAAIGILRDEPERQRRVRKLARDVRLELSDAGLTLPPGDSPILPVILGSEQEALSAANTLQMEGLLVLPIRPPTVPRGSSRLRITLSSEHTDGEVRHLVKSVIRLTSRNA